MVSLDEIKAEDWTLNISRYVLPPIGADIPPLADAVADFKAALARCGKRRTTCGRVLVEGGWHRVKSCSYVGDAYPGAVIRKRRRTGENDV